MDNSLLSAVGADLGCYDAAQLEDMTQEPLLPGEATLQKSPEGHPAAAWAPAAAVGDPSICCLMQK